MTSRKKDIRAPQLAILGVLALGTALAWGYDRYSTDGGTTNCAACHGDFNSGQPYTEMQAGGQTWAQDLMETHRTMVDGDCDVCHSTGGRFPVLTSSSRGGFRLSPISCAGCHGRAGDGSPGEGTRGHGAALRQHHWNANRNVVTPGGLVNTRVCGSCHDQRADLGNGVTDANPANFTVVGEQVQPTYYFEETGSFHPSIPDDPCNATGDEDFDGTTNGLDSDGDLVYDMTDTDCSGVQPTPGEASGATLNPMLVTANNPATQIMTIAYDPPCQATGHSLAFGTLAWPFTYAYTGASCAIGAAGPFAWDYSGVAGSAFFVIVANDGVSEGSYGEATSGAQRPQNATCGFAQNLADRCD
jgi:hypothetical protein